MSENGEIYTAGKKFTLPPAVTGWTNSTSEWTLEWVCEVPPAEISLGRLGSTEQMEEKGQTSFESEIQIQKWKSNDIMRKGRMNWPFKGSDSTTNQEECTGYPKKVANKTCTDEKDQTSQMILQFLHKGLTEKMTKA